MYVRIIMNQSICGGFKVTCWAVAAAGAASATLVGAAGSAASFDKDVAKKCVHQFGDYIKAKGFLRQQVLN